MKIVKIVNDINGGGGGREGEGKRGSAKRVQRGSAKRECKRASVKIDNTYTSVRLKPFAWDSGKEGSAGIWGLRVGLEAQ